MGTNAIVREKDDSTTQRAIVEVGLALGGLAGNNAHGAGALQAFLDCGLTPDLISCTSGQIHWVCQYLKAYKKPQSAGLLRRMLLDCINEQNPTGCEPVDFAWFAMRGLPDVLRWAIPEAPFNLVKNYSAMAVKIANSRNGNGLPNYKDCLEMLCPLPAQSFVPLRPDSFFQDISDTFNKETEIGIVFNSYNIRGGIEYVYLNDCARRLLGVKYNQRNRYRHGTIYRPITSHAVREALWLYEYGEPRDVSAIDGAYYRQMMLSELTRAETIYAVRPLNTHWMGPFPTNWFSREDLKTEVNFNGCFSGELDKIELMNDLLDRGMINQHKIQQKGYHKIEVVTIEIGNQRGYFDYASESVEVFDHAYEEARAVIC